MSDIEFDHDAYTMKLLKFWYPKLVKEPKPPHVELAEIDSLIKEYRDELESYYKEWKTRKDEPVKHVCVYPSCSVSIYPGISQCNNCGSTWTGNNILLHETEQHRILRLSLEKLIRIKNNEQ